MDALDEAVVEREGLGEMGCDVSSSRIREPRAGERTWTIVGSFLLPSTNSS